MGQTGAMGASGVRALPSRSTRTWRDSVRLGTRATLVLMSVIGVVTTAAITPQFFPGADRALAVTLGLVVLSQATLITLLVLRPLRLGHGIVVAALTVAWLVVGTGAMTMTEGGTWWPRALLITTSAFLVVTHRGGWVIAMGIILVNAALHHDQWAPNPAVPTLTALEDVGVEAGQYLSFVGVAWLASKAAARAAVTADQTIAASRRARSRLAAARRRATREIEIERLVHDELLHTLRLVALDRSVVPTDVAARSASALLALLGDRTRPAVRPGLVETLEQVAVPDIAVDVHGPPGLALPRHATEAMVAAVREALRNSAQHSGAERAEVVVRRSDTAVIVTVTDEGQGFDPSARSSQLGISRSLHARLQDVGGSATIQSSPQRGARVILRWSPIPGNVSGLERLGGGGTSELVRPLALLCVPFVAQGVFAAVVLAHELRHPWLGLVLTLALAALVLEGARRAFRSSMSAHESLVLGGAAWIGTAGGVWLLPHHASTPRLLWLPIMAAAVPLLLALVRPQREAIVVGVGVSVMILAVLLPGHLGWETVEPYTTTVTAPLVLTGVGMALRGFLDRSSYSIWATETLRLDETTAGVLEEDLSSRLAAFGLGDRSDLMVLLRTIAEDPDRAADEAVRRRARDIEARVREILIHPADPALSDALAHARDSGWSVRCRWTGDLPTEVSTRLTAALGSLPDAPPTLDGAAPVATVSAARRPDGWRLSVVLVPGPDAGMFPPGWVVESGDGVSAVLHLADIGTPAAPVVAP